MNIKTNNMSDTKNFDAIKELAMLSKVVCLNDFYNIDIKPNKPEIRLQGTFNYATAKAAKNLGIQLEFDNETTMLRGNDGIIYVTLTE
jgi:hypothetical protein